ncbi:MAG: hypothetical protein N2745_05135 [Syntrophorhabdaceae bacterium]|nr:hypothetical protein [Syntrophorhabdaceae bacterium]
MDKSDTGRILSDFYVRVALIQAAKGERKGIERNRAFENLFNSSLREVGTNRIKDNGQNNLNNDATGASIALPASSLEDDAKFELSLKTVLLHEGNEAVREANGKEISKFGITESTAKAYGFRGNLEELTKEGAIEIYRKIWFKSGAQSLPYPLSVIHFDTYVNSPAMAKKLLLKSNGDVNLYLNLRIGRYKKLAQLRPERYGRYLKGWINRVKNLQSIASNNVNPYMKDTFKRPL